MTREDRELMIDGIRSRLLFGLDWEDSHIDRWLRAPVPIFDGRTALQMIKDEEFRGLERIEKFIDSMIQVKEMNGW